MNDIRPEKFLTLVVKDSGVVSFVIPPRVQTSDDHKIVQFDNEGSSAWQKAIEWAVTEGVKIQPETLEDMLLYIPEEQRDATRAAVVGAGVLVGSEPEPDAKPEFAKKTLEEIAAAANTFPDFREGDRVGNGVWWNHVENVTSYAISHRIDGGEWQPRIEVGTNNWYEPSEVPKGTIEFAIVAIVNGEEVWSQDITVG